MIFRLKYFIYKKKEEVFMNIQITIENFFELHSTSGPKPVLERQFRHHFFHDFEKKLHYSGSTLNRRCLHLLNRRQFCETFKNVAYFFHPLHPNLICLCARILKLLLAPIFFIGIRMPSMKSFRFVSTVENW